MPTGVYVRTLVTKQHLSVSKKGDLNPWFNKFGEMHSKWKGDKASIGAKHAWIKARYGKADHCDNPNCAGKSKIYQWSNISGLYKRERSDWQQLCKSCHCLFDKGTLIKTWKETDAIHI